MFAVQMAPILSAFFVHEDFDAPTDRDSQPLLISRSRLEHAGGVFRQFFLLIQAGPHGSSQRLGVKRFGEQPDAAIKVVEIGAVPAHVDHLLIRFLSLQFLGQFPAGDTAGHDDVREQQVDLVTVRRPGAQGVDAGAFG